MRINERMGLVYTALFLTVSVAVITQNSASIMAAFRGEANVRAVDDVFTVRAGRDQRLFVLSNDVNASLVNAAAVTLIGNPKCGQVTKTGGSFVYSGSADCTGHQAFTYCLKTGRSCYSASVVLRMVEVRDPIDSVQSGPITDLSGFDAQTDINGAELEITNVHLGRSALSETTAMPATGTKLAGVAVEAGFSFRRPDPVATPVQAVGVFDVATPESFAKQPVAPVRAAEIRTDTAIATDAPVAGNDTTIRLPADPLRPFTVRLPGLKDNNQTRRMAEIDLGFDIPATRPAIDQSPFGMECSTDLTASAAPGGLVELILSAPCLPNSRVEVRHGKMTVTLKTGHSGTLTEIIPAFESTARFSVRLSDGTVLRTSAEVPDLADFDRIAIQWRGAYEIGLHALEFGASPGSAGDVWTGQPGDPDPSDRYAGGYAVSLGDPDVRDPVRVEVYSLSRSMQTRTGVIELVVSAMATPAICGKRQILYSYRSRGGRLVGASGLQFKMPDCADSAQSIVLKNAVRDLIIASR